MIAGVDNTTPGTSNTIYGCGAGTGMTGSTGSVAIGWRALANVVNGFCDTAVGFDAGSSFPGGFDACPITAIGGNALRDNVFGASTAVGCNSMANATGADRSVAVGEDTLRNFQGRNCVAVGYRTSLLTEGGNGNNVMVGILTDGTTTSSNNVVVGNGITGFQNANIYIGNDILSVGGELTTIRIGHGGGGATGCYIDGIRGITTNVVDALPVLIDSAGQLGTVSSSEKYKQDIEPISRITYNGLLNLEAVQFKYKTHPETIQYGLIAEDVAQKVPELAIYKDGEPDTVAYHMLPSMLLGLIQRMDRQHKEEIDALKARIEVLEKI